MSYARPHLDNPEFTTTQLRNMVGRPKTETGSQPPGPSDGTPAESCETDVAFEPAEPLGFWSLLETILKYPERLTLQIRDRSLQRDLVPKLLAISLSGFVFFGVTFSIVLASAGVWPELTAIASQLQGTATADLIEFRQLAGDWPVLGVLGNGSALTLIIVYSVGLIAATGICLPSLYFYGLLAGVRMSLLDVVLHALKSKATAAVALVGITPIYVALAMGLSVFDAPAEFRQLAYLLGLILPFIGGLWGTRELYLGLGSLCDTMPLERRARRECFLRRLVLSWSACYTAVSPVLIFCLWEYVARGAV